MSFDSMRSNTKTYFTSYVILLSVLMLQGFAESQRLFSNLAVTLPATCTLNDEDVAIMVDALLLDCGLNMRDMKRVAKSLDYTLLGEAICDSDEIGMKQRLWYHVRETITFLFPETEQTFLACLSKQHLPSLVSGNENNMKNWYFHYLQSVLGWHTTLRRQLIDQSTPSISHAFESVPATLGPSPSLSAGTGNPSNFDSPSLEEPSPNSDSDLSSQKQNNSILPIILAVIFSVTGTSLIAALFFVIYKRRLKNHYLSYSQRDDSPLLSVNKSDSSDSSTSFGSANSLEKKQMEPFSYKEELVQNGNIPSMQAASVTAATLNLSVTSNSLRQETIELTKPSASYPPLYPPPPIMAPPMRLASVAPAPPPTPPLQLGLPMLKDSPSSAPPLPAPPLPPLNNKPAAPSPPPNNEPGASPPSPNNKPGAPPLPTNKPGAPPSRNNKPGAPPLPNNKPGAPPPPNNKPGVPPPPPPPPLNQKPDAPPLPQAAITPRPPQGNLKPLRSPPVAPRKPGSATSSGDLGMNGETGAPRTKLKPFFWDKVAANPDQSMVWSQLKAGSFQFSEEMIETLFGYTSTNKPLKEGKEEAVKQVICVLDAKKSQNLAISLKALNVKIEEVCDALMEGKELPIELLHILLRMPPTTDEELRLRLYDGDTSQLGPAEQFLMELIKIPSVYKRLDALLFMAILPEEVSGVKESLSTLEAACGELKNNRLFLKLLEAVLKTGNRMNDGTFRGGAQAFKLDTLLKLSDVKGADGKTTLLHFVVQEIIRSEGIRAFRATRQRSTSITSIKSDDSVDGSPEESEDYYNKLGLKVVSSLGDELGNVKRAAGIDADALMSTVATLGHKILKLKEFLNTAVKNMDMDNGFLDSLKGFVEHTEADIVSILEEEKRIRILVKKTIDFFHGKAGKDEGLRLFIIVRDFLGILDKACREVREAPIPPRKTKDNPKPMISETSTQPTLTQPTVPDPRQLLFPRHQRLDDSSSSSSDEES